VDAGDRDPVWTRRSTVKRSPLEAAGEDAHRVALRGEAARHRLGVALGPPHPVGRVGVADDQDLHGGPPAAAPARA
jgi:hypothetical protein